MTARSYHHGNLRAVLVENAVELARATGPDGVVLREVARRAGVSHNAAYRHFADRAALLHEVAAHGMAELAATMRVRVDEVAGGDPGARAMERLRETGRAYVAYAVAEPGLFSVAFGVPVGPPDQAESPALDDPYAILNEVLDEVLAAGAMRPERRPGADLVCWAMVHGYAELHVHGPLREAPDADRDAGLEIVLDLAQAGLTSAT